MTGESLYPRDLIERLRGALDERERVAIAAAQTNGNRWEREWAFSTHFVVPTDVAGSTAAVNVSRLKPSQRAAAEHIAANDPAHVLSTIRALRKIIDEHVPVLDTVEWPHDQSGKGEAMVCPRCQNADHHTLPPLPIGAAGVLPEGFIAPYVLAPCNTLRALASIYFPESDA